MTTPSDYALLAVGSYWDIRIPTANGKTIPIILSLVVRPRVCFNVVER